MCLKEIFDHVKYCNTSQHAQHFSSNNAVFIQSYTADFVFGLHCVKIENLGSKLVTYFPKSNNS